MADGSVNEAPLYPAIYRQSKTRSLLFTLIVLIAFVLKTVSSVHGQFPLIALIFIPVVLVTCSIGIFKASRSEIVLYEDRIEISHRRKTRVISLDQIFSIKRAGFGRLRIYCKLLNGPDVYIPSGIGGDAAWNVWMARVNGGEKLMKKDAERRSPADT